MKYLITTISFAMLLVCSTVAFAGNCDYSYERASDGSRCGGRAADQRPGGR